MRYHTLCKSILKCRFPLEGIKLTWFVLFKVLRLPQLWGTSVKTILVGTAQKFAKYKRDYWIRNFNMLDKLVRHCICSQHCVFPLPRWYFPVRKERSRQSEKIVGTVLRVEVIIFSWCSCGLSLTGRNLKKWILMTKSSCIRCSTKNSVYKWVCATEDACTKKVVWVKHCRDLTVLSWNR